MKTRSIVLAGLMLILLSATGTAQEAATTEAANKQLIQQAFDKWAAGTGNFFDLLAEDVEWTIAGTSPVSGVFKGTKKFEEEAVKPITDKLDGRIVPVKLLRLYTDGDAAVLLWQGDAKAKDGLPYKNTYCWQLTLKGGRIVPVTAFLDTYALQELMTRVKTK